MFGICSDVVEGRRKKSPGLDTTRMLNELLADDSWLEQVSILSQTFSRVFLNNQFIFRFCSNLERCKTSGPTRTRLSVKSA